MMDKLPQVYGSYDLLFTPQLIATLRDVRGEEWAGLVDRLSTLPETHPDALAFSMMVIQLNSCVTCEMDSYRAQRGCAACARHAVISFKGSDKQLLKLFDTASQAFAAAQERSSLTKAA
jgi:hypothetical protein